ncbi:MAG TPA: 2,3-bisphosphoglycerate-independent phosphoglycerate mutase, partial [Firmicutes bacterium]|nr:2,3-bisphosphoglycerate-independent phosphoglycerate mutase [Bacillota bacterium]
NSEVGHLNMGAGRTVYQSLTLINKNLKDGTFFTNEHYVHAIKKAVETGHKLHIFGLLSDGGVHSHIRHILAMVKMAKMYGVGKDQLLFHCFLDGRD